MASAHAVPLSIENCTDSAHVRIAIFTERQGKSMDANERTEFTAWMILNVPSVVSFTFPSRSTVCSSWETNGTTYKSGPFDAPPGSTWLLTEAHEEDYPVLEMEPNVRVDKMIVIKNTTCSKYFDVSLCKLDRPLMTEYEVGPGQEVVLKPITTLWFVLISDWVCAVQPKQGQMVNSLADHDIKTSVNLHAFRQKGARVVLQYDEEEDKYSLSPLPA